MISLNDIVRSLMGAWRLARLDPAGMHYFDTSIEGFWRSFWAAAVAAPLHFALAWYRIENAADGPVHAWLVEILAYAVGWTAFPVAALYLTEAFDCGKRYVAYIVAYNWTAVIITAAYAGATAIVWLFMSPEGVPDEIRVIRVLFFIAVVAALWFFQYFVARTALSIPGPVAMAIVACDVLIGYFITWAVNSIHHPEA